VEGSQLAVTDVGRGPALLFVHTGAWSFIWRDLLERLSGDFRCVCFDAPSTGRSAAVPRPQTNLARAARAAAGVIEQLDLRDYTLVAHDLGGLSGIAGAAAMPERVRGIVAMNTFGWKPETGLRRMLSIVGSAAFTELDARTGLLPRITSTAFGIGRHMDDAGRRAFRAGMPPSARRAFHDYMRDAGRSGALYTRIHDALTGPFARLPLLTIFGERNDPFHFQPRWRELFPHAVQMVVAKGNHFPMCDDPDLVAQTIQAWHEAEVKQAR
jgi:pimeloyl-ACP methyl ester carboxylesterase